MSLPTGSGSPPCPDSYPDATGSRSSLSPPAPCSPGTAVHRREVGLHRAATHRTPTHPGSDQDTRPAVGRGESAVGAQADPRRTGPTRVSDRSLHGLGDPQRGRHRPRAASLRPHLARVPDRASRGHHRGRLLPHRHRPRQTVVRVGVPRARHPAAAHHRGHRPPDTGLGSAAGPGTSPPTWAYASRPCASCCATATASTARRSTPSSSPRRWRSSQVRHKLPA